MILRAAAFVLHLLYACSITQVELTMLCSSWFFECFADSVVLCVSVLTLWEYFCIICFPSSPSLIFDVFQMFLLCCYVHSFAIIIVLLDSTVLFQFPSWKFFGEDWNTLQGSFFFPTTFFFLVQCHSGANLKCCVLQDSSSSFQIFALPCDSFLKLGEYCCIPSFLHLHCFPCVTEVASSLMILAQFRSDLPYWVHMWCFSFFLLESSLMKSEQFCSDIGFPSCVLLTFA